MRILNEDSHQKKKIELMEKCYDCYAEYGLNSVGIKGLAKACGMCSGSLYTYFEDLDDLIIQSTAHCMSKVEDEFMEKAPHDPGEIIRFIDEIPYWTAEKHGKKYRLMYQIYTHPKYKEYGKQFFMGVNERYTEYARSLESQLGIPYDVITPIIFIFVRACVHYALFEDEYYLKTQLEVLKKGLSMFVKLPEDKTAGGSAKKTSAKKTEQDKKTAAEKTKTTAKTKTVDSKNNSAAKKTAVEKTKSTAKTKTAGSKKTAASAKKTASTAKKASVKKTK